MNTYEIIKELAKSNNISISELERILGVSNGFLIKWKTRKPNPIILAKIADYFHVSTDYLLGRESSEKKPDEFAQFFKMKTDGMTDEDIETLKGEWLDYLEIRTRRLEKRNATRKDKLK